MTKLRCHRQSDAYVFTFFFGGRRLVGFAAPEFRVCSFLDPLLACQTVGSCWKHASWAVSMRILGQGYVIRLS